MGKKTNSGDVLAQLAAGIIVPMTAQQWQKLENDFPLVEAIETGMSGQIRLVRRAVPGKKGLGWALVEQPEEGKRVIRPLKNEKEARALIQDRLGAYERMWDG